MNIFLRVGGCGDLVVTRIFHFGVPIPIFIVIVIVVAVVVVLFFLDFGMLKDEFVMNKLEQPARVKGTAAHVNEVFDIVSAHLSATA